MEFISRSRTSEPRSNKYSGKRSCGWLAASILSLGCVASAVAAPIAVPNQDFSAAGNRGTIGGGVIGGSGSSQIGSGPWDGTYFGALGLLAPPTLTIRNGSATIGGLAGVNVLGIANNGGYFSQTLSSTPWQPNRHYVLGANVDVGGVLGAGVLANSNAGLGLGSNGAISFTTASGASGDISVSLLSGTTYHVTLSHNTGSSVSGNVTVALLAEPQNLVSANLLSAVTFSNVTLSSSALNPIATGIAPGGGTPQGAAVNTQFASPFSVVVTDADGDPVPGATVTFTAPSSGPGVVLSSTTAVTDANGVAKVTGTANGTAGSYVLTATVSGVSAPATFQLTNLAGAASSVTTSSGSPQSATVNTMFTQTLGVTVTDKDGNPVAGIGVTFAAPGSGASATFPNNGVATTDSSGHAQISATANTVAGPYTVTASVSGATTSATFNLTNTAGDGYLALPASGTPQSAKVMTPFDLPLVVQITDAYNNPVSGAAITFEAPSSGPSATFDGGVTTIVVNTDADGIAQVDATANDQAGGPYQITASGVGLSTEAVFNLTNTALAPPNGNTTSGNGQTTTTQSQFNCMLQIQVTSSDTMMPLSGVSIDFVAPTSGPSATLSDSSMSGKTTLTETTDSDGKAGVMAMANGIPGSYQITAGVTGSGTPLATFDLMNLAPMERIFADGFEDPATACGSN